MAQKGAKGEQSLPEAPPAGGGFFDFSEPVPGEAGLFDLTLDEDEALLGQDLDGDLNDFNDLGGLGGIEEDGSVVIDAGLDYGDDDEFDDLPTTLPSQMRYESLSEKPSAQPKPPSSLSFSGARPVDPWAALRSSPSTTSYSSSPMKPAAPILSSSPSRHILDSNWDTSHDAVLLRKNQKSRSETASPMKAPTPIPVATLAPAVQQLFMEQQQRSMVMPHQQEGVAPSVQQLFQAAQAGEGHVQGFFAQAQIHHAYSSQPAYAPGPPGFAPPQPQPWPELAQAQVQAAMRAQTLHMAHAQRPPQPQPQPQPTQSQPPQPESRRGGDERRRPRWRRDKTYLTADDMENLVRMSEYQLQCDNPYLEDFYFQNYMKRRAPERASKTLLLRHRPIHEVLRPAGTIKKRQGENPFQGALGRIPGHSVRAPRPLVELRLSESTPQDKDQEKDLKENGEKEGANQNDDDEETARAMVALTEGLSSLQRTLALAIENALVIVLELEDLDAILSSIAADPSIDDGRFNIAQLQEKRLELTTRLFEQLHVQPNPAQAPNFAIHKEALAIAEDDLFIKFLTLGKGSRLLRRALMLLFPVQQLAFCLALLRNLHVIVSLPNSDAEDAQLRVLFQAVMVVLTSLPLPQFLVAVQTLVSYHCTAPYFRRRITNTVKSKVGSLVFTAALRRGYEHALALIQQAQQGVPAQTQAQIRSAIESWKGLIVTIYEHLAGNMTALFTSSVSKDYTNVAPPSFIWDCLFALALNASPGQKRDMKEELQTLMEDADSDANGDENDPLRQRVRTLLRALSQ